MITYKSPTIETDLRTFEAKSLMKDPPEGVVPGAMAQVVVILDRRDGLGIPVQAIQKRGGQSAVFVIEDQTARQRIVETGYTQDGWIELTKGDIAESHRIVTMGQYQLDDGTAVSVQQEER